MHTPALSVVHSPSIALPILPSQTSWRLAGVISNARYVERAEKEALVAVQARPRPQGGNPRSADPDQEIEAWWQLTQEERRKIFEDKSQHIAGSLKYLPAIARQLYHCRDLGEPFDFITWFEFAPGMPTCSRNWSACCRATEEWTFCGARGRCARGA